MAGMFIAQRRRLAHRVIFKVGGPRRPALRSTLWNMKAGAIQEARDLCIHPLTLTHHGCARFFIPPESEHEQGQHWYRKAAQGYANAQFNLGLVY